jgi:class 3 adenylate cyclase
MTSPLPLHPEERRLATILFADIQGFTALAEHLDFEEVSDIVKEIWERVDLIIERNNGYIDKHIGDAVMAVWGAPQAREDDAERAVSAALELQRAIADYAAHSARTGTEHLKMRVGVHTGLVLAGYVGKRGEYTVMGDTVNVASRLETSAEPQTVIISQSTYQLVRGMFDIHPVEPLKVKGRVQPLSVFRVEGMLIQPNRIRYRSTGRLETNMVGREAEIKQLAAAYQRMRHSAKPTLVIVRGACCLSSSISWRRRKDRWHCFRLAL